VERLAAPEHDDRREQEREPLPAGELQGGHHRHEQHRHGEHRADPPAAAEVVGVVLDLVLGLAHAVAGGLDDRDELLEADAGGRLDVGGLGRVVHRGDDAGHLVELLLDPHRARGARHPGDLQVERDHSGQGLGQARRCGRGHGGGSWC